MIKPDIILAGTFITGLFFASCGSNEVKKPAEKKSIKLETVPLDTMPINCQLDTMLQLGFIDKDWVYQNKPLGIQFHFPKGWNAIEDISNTNPTIVPVDGDLGEFRENYTHPHKLKLSLMKGNAWGEKRYLFGITKIEPRHPLDETPLDFNAAPLAIAQVFYGEEFASEDALYKVVIGTLIDGWEENNNRQLFDLNRSTIYQVKKQHLGNTGFYAHSVKFPLENSIVEATTLVKKIDCLFLVISFNWKNDKEKNEITKALEGITITRTM